MKIADLTIGQDKPPFIIAEMSGNHSQSIDVALELVRAAAKAGATAIKLQTYKPETMTLDSDYGEFFISDKNSPWVGNSAYSLYEKACTPWEWHQDIFEEAKRLGILAFSSPFDATAVDFLEQLDVPCYKIASFEIVDTPLIKKVAATGKPLIVSTGMATLTEISEAVDTIKACGNESYALLKCTSSYPASPESANLRTLQTLRENFGCEVGVSDHTLGTGVAAASIALGSSIIEKHITLDRSAGGVDSAFSLEPHEFESLVVETRSAWLALGKVNFGPTDEEMVTATRRRSLYVVEDVEVGSILTSKNVKCIRPGLGLAPKYYDMLVGREFKVPAKKGTPLDWSLLR